MKQFIYIIAAISLLAFTSVKFDNQKAAAIVNQEQGLYLFTDSRPQVEYETLTTIKANYVNITWDATTSTYKNFDLSYSQLKENVFDIMKKKKNVESCKGAQGIIFYPEQQKADVIKFK